MLASHASAGRRWDDSWSNKREIEACHHKQLFHIRASGGAITTASRQELSSSIDIEVFLEDGFLLSGGFACLRRAYIMDTS
jgi:hypothetical protein